jgi:glutamine synthetase
VADSLDYIATELEKAVEKGADFADAVGKLLVKLVKENKRIIFNGNGYADAWQKEAGKRGLLNLRNTVDALPQLISDEAVTLFETYKVLNKRELEARLEINFETYNKSINVEAQTMVLMANRYILPAALGYLTQVAQGVAAGKAAGVQSKEARKLLVQVSGLVDSFKQRTEALTTAIAHEGNGDSHKHAKYMRDKVIPAMAALREVGDAIESVAPSNDWPLPTYREMLFIK